MPQTSSTGMIDEPDELELIRSTVREIASDYDDRYWMDVADGMDVEAFWQDCADAGILGTVVDEQYGGEGLGFYVLAEIVKEFAANGCMGTAMLFVVNVCFGAITLTENGTDAQKEALLPPLVDGDLRFSMALTEPNAGHNIPNIETTADATADGYRIDGTKQWISGVDKADRMLVVARTAPLDQVESRTDGVTLFLVDPRDDSISLQELDVGIPTLEKQFEVSIDGYLADEGDVVGTEGMGLYQLFDTVNPERVLGAAGAVGTGRCALRRAIDYATEREVFDQPIGAHQAIQHPIAEAHSKLEGADLLARRAAWMIDHETDPRETAKATNIAKLRASEVAQEATDVAVQTHGGNGFSRDYGVIEMWKASRLGTVAPGSSEMMRNHIAEHALDLPRSY